MAGGKVTEHWFQLDALASSSSSACALSGPPTGATAHNRASHETLGEVAVLTLSEGTIIRVRSDRGSALRAPRRGAGRR